MHFQKKNSLLCPGCRKLISASEKVCPYCGMKNPSSRLRSSRLYKAFASSDGLLQAIITVNIAMYAISILINPGSTGLNFSPLRFLAPSNQSLLLLGSTGAIPVLELDRWWSLVAANYLHGGLLHILFNMMALRQIGPLAAAEFGSYRMFIIYTLGGVAGFLASVLAGIPFTIGASAALCGLIGAALYYGKSRGGAYGQAIYSQTGRWAVFIFLFGFMVPGINNWGHGGGMAAGALLGFLLGYNERKRETPNQRLLALILGAVTVVVLIWAVLTSLIFIIAH